MAPVKGRAAPDAVKPSVKRRFQRRLLHWYRTHARDLPWRRTRDPYRILVSEIMLQQTQVSRVLDYYPRFLERYPTVDELAQAQPRQVREAWEGLGYYARAHNLHRAARQVVHQHGGRFPRESGALTALPGVGRYTAGALLSFAHEIPAPILDTNVRRLLARVFLPRRRTNGSGAMRHLWELAAALVPPRRAWAFNQALIDFGALVCTPRNPRCNICRFTDLCRSYPSFAAGQDKPQRRGGRR
ncbi:MAG: A/G-specific adenine glycosylase [Candidatus Methylomirabilales bacterium]